MKIKRFLGVIAAFALILGTVSVNAAAPNALPANEPWVLSHVDWYQDAHLGAYTSIAHHPRSGRAYISYYDDVNTALKMAHEVAAGTGNCGPGNSWWCEIVQSSTSVGRYSSIAVAYVALDPPILSYTKIGISYYDASKQRLRYAQCVLHIGDSACEWIAYNVDDSGEAEESYGRFSSLAFDSNAVPHIAYNWAWDFDLPNPDISGVKYASYVGEGTGNCIPDGSWDCTAVSLSMNYMDDGANCSLDFNFNDVAVISFYKADISALVMAVHQPGDGSICNNNWNCYLVDNSSDVGRFSSLHAQKYIGDASRIAYYDSVHKQVKFAEFVGTGGNCTSNAFDCYTVDTTAEVYPTNFDPISMDVDAQGYPIIAFMNSSTESSPDYIEVARPAIAYGLPWGNCGDVRDGEMFQYWTCRTVDPPDSNINKGSFLSVDVAPSGLAAIAYAEQDLQRDGLYLKVAQQRFGVYLPMIKR